MKRSHIYYLYAVNDPKQEPRYVGHTVNLRQRLWRHRKECEQNHQYYKHNWMQSVGVENVRIRSINTFPSAAVPAAEKAYILLYRLLGYRLTNLTSGGDGKCGWIPSAETRKKWSIARKGKKFPPDWCAKISAAQRGKKKGPLSSEHRIAMSIARTGKKISPHSLQHRAALSKAMKDRGPWNKGKKLSFTHKRKISETKKESIK